MKLILFDIDGTLLYTGGAGRIAFERAFEELFGEKDVWQDLIPDGKTDPIIVEEILARTLRRPLSAGEYESLVIRYHYHFEIEIQNPPQFVVLPGVRKLLQELSNRKDLLLGIVTGNFEQAAQAKLRKGDLHHYFHFGGYASDAADRAELTRIGFERGQRLAGKVIQREDVFVVGDTPHDVRAAKAIGAKVIGVATGRTDTAAFRDIYQADFALADLSDTESFMRIIGGKDTQA